MVHLMPPPLLISDSNILIDLDCCGLLPKVFKLPFQIAVPDVLYLGLAISFPR